MAGNKQFGAGQETGKEKGWDEAKVYFEEKTGMNFDAVCDKGKITAIFYGNLLLPSER